MTISSSVNRKSAAGNGVTTAFSFPYTFTAQADLVVLLVVDATGVSTTKTITTHYTVSGTTDSVGRYPSGGTVTMLTAPAAGETLVIYSDPAITQSLDLVENDPLPAEELEKAYDKLTLMIRRVRDLLGRAFTLADSDTSGASLVVPTPAASKLIGWNSAGTGLTNYASSAIVSTIVPTAFMETVLDDVNASAARTTLGVAIGSDVQAYDATLASVAGLTLSQGCLLTATAADAGAVLAKGTASQQLRMNAGATAPEWFTPAATTGTLTAGTPLVKNPTAANSTTTQAHGLASTPIFVSTVMECLSADLNYSAGDKLIISDLNAGGANNGINTLIDATNVILLISASIVILNKTSYVGASIDMTKWKITSTPYSIT